MKDALIPDDLFQESYQRVRLFLQSFAFFLVFPNQMKVFDQVDHLRNSLGRFVLTFLHRSKGILFSDLDLFYHLTFVALN